MQRTRDVPEYQLGAFMLEMANLINSTETFNGSHVIAGASLAQKQLQAEVKLNPAHCYCQLYAAMYHTCL